MKSQCWNCGASGSHNFDIAGDGGPQPEGVVICIICGEAQDG